MARPPCSSHPAPARQQAAQLCLVSQKHKTGVTPRSTAAHRNSVALARMLASTLAVGTLQADPAYRPQEHGSLQRIAAASRHAATQGTPASRSVPSSAAMLAAASSKGSAVRFLSKVSPSRASSIVASFCFLGGAEGLGCHSYATLQRQQVAPMRVAWHLRHGLWPPAPNEKTASPP